MNNPAKTSAEPLVTIIIPCYNHGKYLPQAIESILSQDYKNVEIILVDDGSTDDTAIVSQKYPELKYVYQPNQGLSAARNTGINFSKGKYLVFLDADDWLLPGAISTNLRFFQQREDIAFVSGAYQMLLAKHGNIAVIKKPVPELHYNNLLTVNYIGMHAAVMFKKSVMEEFRYDTSLRASEDYDLYLRIARKFPVMHHTEPIAMYRKHESNMSGNIPLMLEYTILVLNRQRAYLEDKTELRCLEKGIAFWKSYYATEVYTQLRTMYNTTSKKRDLIQMLKKHSILLYLKYLIAEIVNPSKMHLKPTLT